MYAGLTAPFQKSRGSSSLCECIVIIMDQPKTRDSLSEFGSYPETATFVSVNTEMFY